MAQGKISILDPTAPSNTQDSGLAPRVGGLGGGTLGLISNSWRSFDVVSNHIEQMAKERYEVREVMRTINPDVSSPTPKDTLNILIDKSDAAIVGMGH